MAEQMHVEYARVVAGPNQETIDLLVDPEEGGELRFQIEDLRAHCLPYDVDFAVEDIVKLDEVPGALRIVGKATSAKRPAVIIYHPLARSGWITWSWKEAVVAEPDFDVEFMIHQVDPVESDFEVHRIGTA